MLGEGAKVSCWVTRPAVGKFVKVNDTWLEVVGVLGEQICRRIAELGRRDAGHSTTSIYIPLNTFQYRFWDQSSFMKDDLDGIDMRLKPECRQH